MQRITRTRHYIAAAALIFASSSAWAQRDTLTWTSDQDVDTLDVYYAQLREQLINVRHVCDSLLFSNPRTQEYEGLLATSYKWVDDLTLEFDLRKGVKFHDGRDFSSADVVYTLMHAAAPDSGIINRNNVQWIKDVVAIDDHTVRINLKEPFPAALEYLAGNLLMMPNGHYDNAPSVGERKDYGQVKPICTGPYKLVEIIPGERVVLERFDGYFKGGPKGTPSIKRLVYRTIPDKESQIAALLTGDVDWIWAVPKDAADAMRSNPQVKVIQEPIMRFSYLQMNTTAENSPFNDIRVRKAVSHAINKKAIAQNIVGQGSVVLDAPCYVTQFGCTQEVQKYEYDPEKAKALLAEAGYPNGLDVDLWAYRERQYVEAMMGQLAAVGIRPKLNFVQYPVFRQATREGKTLIANGTWGSNGVNDISSSTSYFFRMGADDQNKDEQVAKWLEIGDNTADPAKRKENYRKALERIAEQAYWAPLFSYSKIYIFNKDLEFEGFYDEWARFYWSKWKQ